jgi:hypothetical protein
MQLKIIVKPRQCRGHPPIRGTSRDGPGSSKFKFQSSKLEILKSLVNLRVLSALMVRRRWGERVGSWQPRKTTNLRFGSFSRVLEIATKFRRNFDYFGIGSQSAVSGQRSANLVFGIWNLEFGIPDLRSFKFRSSLARDWINYTCSVGQQIIRYRYKHRWRATFKPARGGGEGEVCL